MDRAEQERQIRERAERERQLRERLNIEIAPDGTRYLTLEGVALARLTREEAGRWRCEWRDGWRPIRGRLEQDETERAEAWAAKEVAAMLAMEEAARRAGR